MYQPLPESLRTVYAELLEQSVFASAEAAAVGDLGGTFLSKRIKGRTYWYLQRTEGGSRRQIYLGADSLELRRWVERVQRARREASADERQRRDLCAMLAAGGATRESAAVTQTLELLAAADLFRLGGVLVGTVAFATQGTMLGVRFAADQTRTGDIDIAQEADLGIVLADEVGRSDVATALSSSPLGFLPVPMLRAGEPSTSFKVRGRELRVDFLTPLRGPEREAPVRLATLNVAAQPLRFLDYLIEGAVPAVVIGPRPVLVQVPLPARTAWHKLWTSQRRGTAQAAKAAKDLSQATDLLAVLLAERPTDLEEAWRALPSRRGMITAVRRALARLPKATGEALAALEVG